MERVEESERMRRMNKKRRKGRKRRRLFEASDAPFEAEPLPFCFVSTSCLCWLHLLLVVLPLWRLSTGKSCSLDSLVLMASKWPIKLFNLAG